MLPKGGLNLSTVGSELGSDPGDQSGRKVILAALRRGKVMGTIVQMRMMLVA